MVTIKLNDLVFEGTHGVYEKEQHTPQRFRIDVEIELASENSAHSGELPDTVDWAPLREKIRNLVEGKNLILAEKIANEICDLALQDNNAKRVSVEVAKLDAWGGGEKGYPSAVVSKAR